MISARIAFTLRLCTGGDDGFQYWWDRLAAVTGCYSRVVMLGDSMGATAALMFSPLATAVHAFTPQVGLLVSSPDTSIWQEVLSVLTRIQSERRRTPTRRQVVVGVWHHVMRAMSGLH